MERTRVVGREKNGTDETLVDAIAHLLQDAGRRVRVVLTPGPDADDEAVRLARATLATDTIQATLPRLPLPEDRHPPHHMWGIRD